MIIKNTESAFLNEIVAKGKNLPEHLQGYLTQQDFIATTDGTQLHAVKTDTVRESESYIKIPLDLQKMMGDTHTTAKVHNISLLARVSKLKKECSFRVVNRRVSVVCESEDLSFSLLVFETDSPVDRLNGLVINISKLHKALKHMPEVRINVDDRMLTLADESKLAVIALIALIDQ